MPQARGQGPVYLEATVIESSIPLIRALPILSQVIQVACSVHYSASASSSWWPTLPSRYAYTPCLTWTSFWVKTVSDGGATEEAGGYEDSSPGREGMRMPAGNLRPPASLGYPALPNMGCTQVPDHDLCVTQMAEPTCS